MVKKSFVVLFYYRSQHREVAAAVATKTDTRTARC
jgi:hypothetical protein